MKQLLKVDEPAELLAFLFEKLPESNKTRVRKLLKWGNVSVRGRITTQFNYELRIGDEVLIESAKSRPTESGLQVLFEDDDLIAISKPTGLLSIATDKIRGQTAISVVNKYINQKASQKSHLTRGKKSAFIVHRLDRDVSGVMVFAKNENAKNTLQKNWAQFTKEYAAVVEGCPEKSSGTWVSYLSENKILSMVSGPERPGAREATTHYEVIQSGKKYSLLSVKLGTGRKHQIRVHLADLDCPVMGDKKYGAKTNPLKRIALHAQTLKLLHPKTGKPLTITSPAPSDFKGITK